MFAALLATLFFHVIPTPNNIPPPAFTVQGQDVLGLVGVPVFRPGVEPHGPFAGRGHYPVASVSVQRSEDGVCAVAIVSETPAGVRFYVVDQFEIGAGERVNEDVNLPFQDDIPLKGFDVRRYYRIAVLCGDGHTFAWSAFYEAAIPERA